MIMNKISGYFYKIIGKITDYFLQAVMFVVDIMVGFFKSIQRAFAIILSMGGCLFVILILNPVFLYEILKRPWLFTLILLAFIFPILGTFSIGHLKYVHYMVTEYLYDKSDYYLLGRKRQFEDMESYGRQYRIKEEEERFKEQERRRKEREAEWNRRFEEYEQGGFHWEFINFNDFFDPNGPFQQYYQQQQQGYQGQYQNQGGYNPQSFGISFIKEYEESCDILKVPYTADKDEIKLAYRKLAKEYHPDLNRDPGATEMFQKIGNAYEFLNDSNIERYKSMKGNQ